MTDFNLKLAKNTELIEQLAEVDDEITEPFLDDVLPSDAQLAAAIQWVTISFKFSPVFVGSAIKNTAADHPSMVFMCTSRVQQSMRSLRMIQCSP